MTKLSVPERMELIRYHGAMIAAFGKTDPWPDTKSNILNHLARLNALIKTIPKSEFGVE